MIKPSVTTTNKPLPFGNLSLLEFKRKGYLRPQHRSEAGSKRGRDIVAYKPTDAGEELWYFQCKCYERTTGIIFATSAYVPASARDNVSVGCQEHGYTCDFWARTELDIKVKKHPDTVLCNL